MAPTSPGRIVLGDGSAEVRTDHGSLTAWWRAVPRGFEQGLVVAARPGGVGSLVVDVGVEGAEAAAHGAGATLRDVDGQRWSVDGLLAWDAGGRPLPASMHPTVRGLRIRVDDDGAAYPVTIDPTWAYAEDVTVDTWEGEAAFDGFGTALANAGDVDGDGWDDLLVGASLADGAAADS